MFARCRRFEEELRLLREEMQRTVAFGGTAALKWDELASAELPNSTAELTEGRQAYAAEQADRERRTAAYLNRQWAGILAKADQYLDGRAPVETGEVMIRFDLGDELDPEDEEAMLEGDLDED